MQMLNYLHFQYPQAHITLHAGELLPGLVPPDDLTFSYSRIGSERVMLNGLVMVLSLIMNEDQPYELLKELVRRNVRTEICLSSNAAIFRDYRQTSSFGYLSAIWGSACATGS
jgi:hypothetical protein